MDLLATERHKSNKKRTVPHSGLMSGGPAIRTQARRFRRSGSLFIHQVSTTRSCQTQQAKRRDGVSGNGATLSRACEPAARCHSAQSAVHGSTRGLASLTLQRRKPRTGSRSVGPADAPEKIKTKATHLQVQANLVRPAVHRSALDHGRVARGVVLHLADRLQRNGRIDSLSDGTSAMSLIQKEAEFLSLKEVGSCYDELLESTFKRGALVCRTRPTRCKS